MKGGKWDDVAQVLAEYAERIGETLAEEDRERQRARVRDIASRLAAL